MNRYHLQVITEYAGLVSFSVEAENFTVEHNAYWFYIQIKATEKEISEGKYTLTGPNAYRRQAVAVYPMDKTIVQEIEKI